MMRQFQAVATVPNCADGADNDGDGLIDFAGSDPGCDDATDAGERSATLPCDDGIDNDGDGTTDYPGDLGCVDPSGLTEVPEPSMLIGLAAGIALLATIGRRRR